ncbi:MAG: EamA family transporter, partial [Bacteroidales bacterium]|nr:EamA family transporter [Bacteroidales bacterium]
VLSWFMFYQTLMMLPLLLFVWLPGRSRTTPFQWRWSIPFISIFLVSADFLYFQALSQPGALIAVISMIRRGSAVVSFLIGAFFLKERNIKSKAFDLLLLLLSMVFLYLGSR